MSSFADSSPELKTVPPRGTAPVPPRPSADSLIAKARRKKRMDRIQAVVLPLILVAILVAIWTYVSTAGQVEDYILPPPKDVLDSFWDNRAPLWDNSKPTLLAISLGFALAASIGFLLALAIYVSKIVERAIYPLLVTVQAVPKVALAPLVAIWFGFTLETKSLIAFTIAVFPMVIDTLAGLRSIENEKILLARSLGLSPVQTYLKIRIPQALPSIFAGLKNALALAVVGAIVGEFVGGTSGLGILIERVQAQLDTALIFAALVVLAVYSIVLFYVVEFVEWLVMPWNRQHGGH